MESTAYATFRDRDGNVELRHPRSLLRTSNIVLECTKLLATRILQRRRELAAVAFAGVFAAPHGGEDRDH
jgi:hypothetical protein